MAEQRLKCVRRNFVAKVTKRLIGLLVDDLFHDGVLSEGKMELILLKNNVTEDMARGLIDMVTVQGDTASQKMIDHIQSRDPTLHSDLGLSGDSPAPPAPAPRVKQIYSTSLLSTTADFWRQNQNDPNVAPAPQVEQICSTSLIPTTADFWRQNQRDPNIYPGTKKSIGNRVALLITNIKFADEKKYRHGAEKDERNMENHLAGLGYEVVKHTNLTAKAIDEAITEFSKHPKLRETDSVVVVIMSHGKLGAILGVDHSDQKPDLFPINNIYKHLMTEKCPALLDKPKIIIIQACRGEEGGSVIVSDAANPDVHCDVNHPEGSSLCDGEDDIEEDTIRCVHKEKDFICLLSCTPDTLSYRRKSSGAYLIQFFIDVSNNYSHKDHIEELFRKVMQRFERLSIRSVRQMATKDRCTLTKLFYFYPGL